MSSTKKPRNAKKKRFRANCFKAMMGNSNLASSGGRAIYPLLGVIE
jgi:hypothetical protein